MTPIYLSRRLFNYGNYLDSQTVPTVGFVSPQSLILQRAILGFLFHSFNLFVLIEIKRDLVSNGKCAYLLLRRSEFESC